MDEAIDRLFGNIPDGLVLYENIESHLLSLGEDVLIRPRKTQISFAAERSFAWVWPPIRRMNNRPESYVILTFGLRRRLEDRRVVEVVEPRPGRWTHHLLVTHPDDLDETVLGWLQEAYRLAGGRGAL